jgi:hypothetical protein
MRPSRRDYKIIGLTTSVAVSKTAESPLPWGRGWIGGFSSLFNVPGCGTSRDMLRATKDRIDPALDQVLDRQVGAVRFVSTKSPHIMRHCSTLRDQRLSAKHDLRKLLPAAKRSRKYAWLAAYDSMSLQQACLRRST